MDKLRLLNYEQDFCHGRFAPPAAALHIPTCLMPSIQQPALSRRPARQPMHYLHFARLASGQAEQQRYFADLVRPPLQQTTLTPQLSHRFEVDATVQHDMRISGHTLQGSVSCNSQAVWLLGAAGRRLPAAGQGAGLLGLAAALLGELRAAGMRRDGGRAFLDTVTPPQVC